MAPSAASRSATRMSRIWRRGAAEAIGGDTNARRGLSSTSACYRRDPRSARPFVTAPVAGEHLRTVVSGTPSPRSWAVNLATVAAAADQCLGATVRAQREDGGLPPRILMGSLTNVVIAFAIFADTGSPSAVLELNHA